MNPSIFIEFLISTSSKYADKTAIVDNGGNSKTSYRELFELAYKISNYIGSKAVVPHSSVSIMLPFGMQYIASEIGIWLSGCTAVPLSVAYPPSRVDYINNHCSSVIRITEDILDEIRTMSSVAPSAVPDKDDNALILYTSGSTGNPKGVLHTFRALDSGVPRPLVPGFDMDNVVYGNSVPLTFAASSFVFDVLIAGGTIHMFSDEIRFDILKMSEYIQNHGITAVMISPAPLTVFHNVSDSLKLVMTAGERLTTQYSKEGYTLYNIYGQTETFNITAFRIGTEPMENVPLGRCVNGIEYRIVDNDDRPVPPGTEGELCIRGPFCKEYYKEPVLTAELFRGGWLHTKDIVKEGEDGLLYYVNRKDFMVKVNGQRVEPGEVERAMCRIEGISDAIVKGFDNGKGSHYLCGYYISDSVSEETIRAELSRTLPSYMIPLFYVRMESFPLNANGKKDRLSLQEPQKRTTASKAFSEPANETEAIICEAFCKVLDLDRVDVNDDFFSLGGDSLNVMRVQQACPTLALSSRIIFKFKTPREIAGAIASERPTASKTGNLQSVPLTRTQLGIFTECEKRPDEALYNNPFLFRFKGKIDTDKLRKAVVDSVSLHPALTAKIIIDGNGIPSMKRDSVPDTDTLCPVERMTETDLRSCGDSLKSPFNLKKDRLCRFRIIETEESQYLFIDVHHIVFDGTSMKILISDIDSLYRGEVPAGETRTAFEIAADEIAEHGSESYSSAKEWYLNTFGDVDGVSIPVGDLNIKEVTLGKYKMDTGITAGEMETFCRKHRTTPNVLSLSAFGYMLSSYTNSDQSAFATIYNGRNSVSTGNTVSMMVKTLPVLCRADSTLSIQQYLDNTKSQLTEAMANDIFSFMELASCTGFSSDVIFIYQADMLSVPSIGGVSLQDTGLDFFTTGENLTVQLFAEEDKLILDIQFHDNNYSSEYIERMADSYVNVLRNIMDRLESDSSARISDIPLVSSDCERELFELGRGEEMEYDKSKTFIDLFREQAARTPDAVAVVDGFDRIPNRISTRLTYKELDEASDEYAKTVTPGTFVCLEMPRTKEFLVATLGIWKAGSAYVPIDTEYPEERKNYMRQESDGRPLPQPGIAYMIYTSGSTGKPKGVMIGHKGLTNYIHSTIAINGVLSSDRISAFRSFSFDSHIEEFYPTLSVGATVYIIPEEIRHDMKMLYEFLKDNHIDGCYFPTSLASLLYDNYDLPVRFIGAVGERLANVVSGKNGVRFLNTYGPTECTDHISAFALENGKSYDSIPIGRPLHNGQVFILDANNRLLPEGCAGELCFSSIQLAVGYWNNPELTAKRFIEIAIGGQKLKVYKTGDLCRWNTDGQLEYICRIDNQVKLRGFRIELGEIESAALQIEGVRQAVALIKNEQIVLYYTSSKDGSTSSPEGEDKSSVLRQALSSSLPEYMVPGIFIKLDSMPLTPNGKINRKELPEPQHKVESIVLPATKDERNVLEIAEDLIGFSPISVTDNLISMGLSSLSALNLSMRLSKILGKEITMSGLMSSPTVRDIAANLRDTDDSILGKTHTEQEFYPLTDNQTGVYLDWERHKDGLQYNLPYVIKLKGYDAQRLKSSIREVVEAHPYLKAGLSIVDGEVKLHRRDGDCVNCTVTALNAEPDNAFFQNRIRPFDLFGEPLYRFEIYTYGKYTYLLRDVHHIITDGLSDNMMMDQIFKAYNGETIEQETFTAYDRALEEQDIKKSEAYDQAKEYYTNLLSGLSGTVYPHSVKGLGEGKVRYVRDILDKTAIKEHCTHLGITAANYLLSVFMEVLRRITREDNVLITAINSGREHFAMQNIQGFFVKTLPIVLRQNPEQATETTAADIQAQLIESIGHECYPLTEMVTILGSRPEILYAYEGGMSKGSTDIIHLNLDTSKMPLVLTVNPDGGSYQLAIEYDDAIYNGADMQTLLNSVITLARNYAQTCHKEPDASLQHCPMLTEEEELRLLGLGTGETLEYDTSETLVDILRKQAADNPDRPFVVYNGKSYTYERVNSITDNIASYLVSSGIKKDEAVGVMINRSELIPIFSLAVLKAGACYMPLDPSLPEDRLLYMCSDAETEVVLTEGLLCKTVLPSFKGRIIDRSEIEWAFDGDSRSSAGLPEICANDRMVILYTSGSTGRPKGVELEHHSIVNFCHWYVLKNGLSCEDVVAAYANYGFDAHMMDIYPTMLSGACVHILSDAIRSDMVKLNDYLETNRVTCAFLTTQIGCQIVSMFDNKSLRVLNVGGEKMPAIEAPAYCLVNGYGPTECSLFSTTYDVKGHFEGEFIGRALANYQLAIVDKNLNLLPEGVAGELVVAGTAVARGYLNQPDLTEEKFICFNGLKAYRTGDLVRWSEDPRDGSTQIEYLGRIDNQVKIRGLRIELGEIENCVSSFPGVKQACAIVREINASRNLVCYYISESGEDLDIENIKEYSRKKLAEFMVPAFFVRMDSFPVNANGKIDRNKLPLPTTTGTDAYEYLEPKGHLEKTIASCIGEVLALDKPVSALDSFTYLGGTSLDAIKLVTILHRKGVECTMGQILKFKNVREMAIAADYASRGEYVDRIRPLYPAQVQIFNDFLSRPDSFASRKGLILDIDAPIDDETLFRVIGEWGERHPELTSSISYDRIDSPVQVFLSGRAVPVQIVNISGESNPFGHILDFETELKLHIPELQISPLVQILFARVSDRENYLLVVFHSIIAEQWRIRSSLADLAGSLAAGQGCGSSLDEWQNILSGYERHVDMRDREDWSKEACSVSVSVPQQNARSDGEDNYFEYHHENNRPTLVFVHTGNTGAEAYAPLAARLKGICSFAVLDQWNLFHQDDIRHGIPDIARKYIEVLKSHQPRGPYYLGGWCYGGMVAYEMACQLKKSGENVPVLVMLDSFCSNDKLWKRSISDSRDADMTDYFTNSPLFADLIARNMLDAMLKNSVQVCVDMLSFKPEQYNGNVLYFKSASEDSIQGSKYTGRNAGPDSVNAGGFEGYISPENLDVVKVKQKHDDMMNEESLDIEAPLIIDAILKNYADR